MAVKLNQTGFDFAKNLIKEEKVNLNSESWTVSKELQDQFLANHSWQEYENWFLGINTDAPEDTKEHYEFPYGDFKQIYRSGVIAAIKRAGQYQHDDIETAASELLDLIDA